MAFQVCTLALGAGGLYSPLRGILQGLRSDERQRVERPTEHYSIDFSRVADVLKRIFVQQHKIGRKCSKRIGH